MTVSSITGPLALAVPIMSLSFPLTVRIMSVALKQAIEESAGVKIVSVPMELRMSCATIALFEELLVKLIGTTATLSFTMALFRVKPVVGIDPLREDA